MEEAPENGKESPHSAHANGMNEWSDISLKVFVPLIVQYGQIFTNLSRQNVIDN
jgi:hypothetical protein